APLNRDWVRGLYELFDALNPSKVSSPKKIDHILARWSSVTNDDDEARRGLFTSLPLNDEFRCLIAALYGRAIIENKFVVLGSKDASDVALRCAYYGKGEITEADMNEGYERDKDAFVFAVLFNDRVYYHPELRNLLEGRYLTESLTARYE